MPWQVRVTARAERDLRLLPASDRAAVRDAIQSLEADPSSVDLRKLSGARAEWRVRVGRWRIRLSLDEDTMYVVRVLQRKDAYRD